uniref:Protein kinase domain-containing protein n=1 Tax=Daphnia galeata TaxID=27404 RepID=A0A8J2RRV1_9CRUS|nr:unnamed protein product [Daphnia galeata]
MNSGIKGTRNWYAPELLIQVSQFQRSTPIRGTVKSDVFATGLVFAYLLFDGQHLYGSNEFEIVNNILADKKVNINKIDPSHYALELISKMLKYERVDRISSDEVVIQLKSIKQKLAVKEEEFRQLCKNTRLDLEKIKKLIQFGIDVNGKTNDGWNALHLLCHFDSNEKLIDAIKLLTQFGIDVESNVIDSRTLSPQNLNLNQNQETLNGIIQFLDGAARQM